MVISISRLRCIKKGDVFTSPFFNSPTILGNGSYTYYDYDVDGGLTRTANHKSDDSVISTFDYTLDAIGNRIAMQINGADTVYYEYDGIYQLVEEDRRQSDDSLVYTNYFEYDLAGNRTHLHYVDVDSDDWTYYTYNIENQLTIEEKGGVATYYMYDAAGALLSKKTGEDESTYDYTYEGLIDEFASGENTAYFTYDASNSRIWAKRNGTVEKYVLSGQDVVADYDGNDTLVATYNTPGLDNNLTKKIGENVYFYVKDGQRSIHNLLDSSEVAQNTYDYKAFGSMYGTPTENVANRYRYTAREWESVLDLYFSRARMYNPKLGRFLGRDPLGGGCCGNNYSYACNRPLLFSDPLGLYTVLFKGYDKLKGFKSPMITSMARRLNDEGEIAKVYEHKKEDRDSKAYPQLLEHIIGYKEENCQYPKINIVGYSCGTDTALSLAQKIENFVTEEGIKGKGLHVRNLFYLDFNWGTAHYNYCRHETDNRYKTPDIVANTFHWVTTGKMTEGGCPKCYVTTPCGFTFSGNPFYLPSCSIVAHTGTLWSVWDGSEVGVDDFQMGLRISAIWYGADINDMIIGKADLSVINTSGALTADLDNLGQYGFPNALQADWKGYNMDHLTMGKRDSVADDVADVILALGV